MRPDCKLYTDDATVVRIPTNLLLFLYLVGGSKVIKKLAIHLHKGLQDVVNE